MRIAVLLSETEDQHRLPNPPYLHHRLMGFIEAISAVMVRLLQAILLVCHRFLLHPEPVQLNLVLWFFAIFCLVITLSLPDVNPPQPN